MNSWRVVVGGVILVGLCLWLLVLIGDREASSTEMEQGTASPEARKDIELAPSGSEPSEAAGDSAARRVVEASATKGFIVGVLLNSDDEPVRGSVRATESNGVVQTTTVWNEGRFEFTFEGATDCLLDGVSFGHGSGVTGE